MDEIKELMQLRGKSTLSATEAARVKALMIRNSDKLPADDGDRELTPVEKVRQRRADKAELAALLARGSGLSREETARVQFLMKRQRENKQSTHITFAATDEYSPPPPPLLASSSQLRLSAGELDDAVVTPVRRSSNSTVC